MNTGLEHRIVKVPLSLSVFLVLVITACANSSPDPVRVFSATDQSMSCAQLSREVDALLTSANLTEEQKRKVEAQNLTAFITGQLLLLPTLAMDVSGSEQIRAKSIAMRLERLKTLSQEKVC